MKTLLAALSCTLAVAAAPSAWANISPPDPYPAQFRFPWGIGIAILGVVGVGVAALRLRAKHPATADATSLRAATSDASLPDSESAVIDRTSTSTRT